MLPARYDDDYVHVSWHCNEKNYLSRNPNPARTCFACEVLFVAASDQTGLDTRSKDRRPIKVGIKGRGRSGTSQDSNPASH